MFLKKAVASCGFTCSEDEGYTFQRALEAWRSTNVEQPVCDEHRKPARFRVVKDLQKESYGRPYFTCADCESPCSLWMWADELSSRAVDSNEKG